MIYAGVTADIRATRGAFAVVYGRGEDVHYDAFTPAAFEKALDEVNPLEIRCVIEMPDEGIMETPEKMNPATFARMYCNKRGVPFMFVKTGSLRRELNMADDQTMVRECKLRYPDVEIRGEERQQEETAKAVLLAKYARRFL